MKFTWWKSGEWNTICDVCGFKFKASELRYTGDVGSRAGLMACRACYDPPHPQEFIRPIADQNKLPWTRPEATDQFIKITYAATAGCTPFGMTCQADYMTADCAIVDNIIDSLLP